MRLIAFQNGDTTLDRVTEVYLLKDLFPNAPILALTATATEEVIEDIVTNLKLNAPKQVIGSVLKENLAIRIYQNEDKPLMLLARLNRLTTGCAIVYTKSRKGAEKLCTWLVEKEVNATFYHAGIDESLKTQRLNDFIADKVQVMVSTSAFGMGIDKPNVRSVIHFDSDSIHIRMRVFLPFLFRLCLGAFPFACRVGQFELMSANLHES